MIDVSGHGPFPAVSGRAGGATTMTRGRPSSSETAFIRSRTSARAFEARPPVQVKHPALRHATSAGGLTERFLDFCDGRLDGQQPAEALHPVEQVGESVTIASRPGRPRPASPAFPISPRAIGHDLSFPPQSNRRSAARPGGAGLARREFDSSDPITDPMSPRSRDNDWRSSAARADMPGSSPSDASTRRDAASTDSSRVLGLCQARRVERRRADNLVESLGEFQSAVIC